MTRRPRHPRWRWTTGLALVVLVGALVGCAGSGEGGGNPADGGGPPATAGTRVLVSLGDSYAAGQRPLPGGRSQTSAVNFPALVGVRLGTPARPVEVANFACSGATLTDLTDTRGCAAGLRAPDSPNYADVSQLDAALAYLQSNQGRVAAVTLVIGGNDLTACFEFSGGSLTNEPYACVDQALARLRDRLTGVLQQIRTAAGPDVPIIGLGYPDIYLALYRDGGDGPNLAQQSVSLFTENVDPVLREAYTAVGGRFVDLTTAFQGTVPLTRTTTVAGYGSLPVAVGAICTLTYMCSDRDQHPTSAGHQRIADQVLAAITALQKAAAPSAGPSGATPN